MGLIPLFLFTLLSGLGAGTYAAETFLQKKRSGQKTWLIPLIVLVVFAVGMLAASFHLSHVDRIFTAQVNFGTGMVTEVALACCFFILVLIDFIREFIKKETPYMFRIITGVVGIISIFTMSAAYLDVYGVQVWTNVPSTVLTFWGGDFAMGIALLGLISSDFYRHHMKRMVQVAVHVVFGVGLIVQIVCFNADHQGISPLVASLILAPGVGTLLQVLSKRTASKIPSTLIFICVFVGVALARWAFYAACTLV